MSLTGSGLDSESAEYVCLYGKDSVVGLLASSNVVTCLSPAGGVSGSVVDVRLSVDKEFARGTQQFEVYADPRVAGLVPSRGTVRGGTIVSVVGSGFSSEQLQCRFGSTQVTGSGARVLSSSLVVCRAPPGNVGESVAVDISMNGGVDFSASDSLFHYGRGATVDSLRPSQALAGVSGQTITVLGRHFEQTRELSCKMGLFTFAAVYMSSTVVACNLPVRGTGTATVSLSNDGANFEGSGASLELMGSGGVQSVKPSYGPMSGGSKVTVTGSQFEMLNGTLRCVFEFAAAPAIYASGVTGNSCMIRVRG